MNVAKVRHLITHPTDYKTFKAALQSNHLRFLNGFYSFQQRLLKDTKRFIFREVLEKLFYFVSPRAVWSQNSIRATFFSTKKTPFLSMTNWYPVYDPSADVSFLGLGSSCVNLLIQMIYFT